MYNKNIYLTKILCLICLLFFYEQHVYAEVVFDDTLREDNLGLAYEGNFEIPSDLGKQVGNNLFHSFKTFNINENEQASFSGPASIQNIFSRVTGGESSLINGSLEVQIPNADFYLLNPAGVIFGPDASLNVNGSFHVSTADYISFENENFYAEPLEMETLSTSAPTAFGFLDSDIARISVEGKDILLTQDDNNQAGINVPEGKTISFIGGDIDIQKSYYKDNNNNTITINAPSGNINLISIKSPGEINITESGFQSDGINKMGDISIADNASVDVSGDGSGNITIYADDFVLTGDSKNRANSFGEKDGGKIDIILDNNLQINDTSSIESLAYGKGEPAEIKIFANNLKLNKNSILYNGTSGLIHTGVESSKLDKQKGGDIKLIAENIFFHDTSSIKEDSSGNNTNGGSIKLIGGNITIAKPLEPSGGNLILVDSTVNKASGAAFELIITSSSLIDRDNGFFFEIKHFRMPNFLATCNYEYLNIEEHLSFMQEEDENILSFANLDSFGFYNNSFYDK